MIKPFVAIGAIIFAASMAGRAGAADTGQAALEFKIYCAGCHGFTGHGDGPNASTLPTKPQDFANCAVMAKMPDAMLLKAIKGGGASVGLPSTMPAWASGLSDDQIKGLVAYIRGFCPTK
ncbi:MAG: c-type cytochrome [Candidatus Binataceae bacterium]